MTSQQSQCSVAAVVVLFTAVCHSSTVSWTPKSVTTSYTTSYSTSTTTMNATSVQSSAVTNVTAAATPISTLTSTPTSTPSPTVVANTSSAPVFRTYNRTESSIVNQTSPYSSAPPATTSSDGLQFSTDLYSISPNRTSSTQGQLNHSVELQSTLNWTTSDTTVTSLPLTSVQLTSLQPYTGNTTQLVSFGDNMTSQTMSVTSVTNTSLNVTVTMTTDPIPMPVDGVKTVTLAIGIGVGLGIAVVLLLVIFILVIQAAKRRRRRRYSDKQKLAPSVRNYDRVIHPSHVSTSDRQQQSGAGKIRPDRRRNRRPSTEEVFALEVQPSAAANANSSPSPNGSADPTPSPMSRPSKRDRKPGKQSTRKEDKSNAQRCLRGMPPELQNSSYFVPDDDGGGTGASSNKKSARNDPFWEAPEAHSTPRRPSIAEQSTSLFKPSRSSENLASTNEGVAAVGTSNVPMSFVILSSGDIGESSTDNAGRVA